MSISSQKITFAIPFYRGVAYLEKSIASVINQTFKDWVCVVYDDGDESELASNLVKRFNDQRISYVKNPSQLGLAGNWNQCINSSQTELVTILHADDELLPNYAEEMVKLSDSYKNASIYFCRAEIIDENSQKIVSFVDEYKKVLEPKYKEDIILENEDGLAAIVKGNFIICPTCCYRRELVKQFKFDQALKFTVDWNFYVDLIFAGQSILGTKQTLFRYRRHLLQTTVALTKNSTRFEEELQTVRRVYRLSREKNWKKAQFSAVMHVSTQIHILVYFVKALVKFDLSYCKKVVIIGLRHYFQIVKM